MGTRSRVVLQANAPAAGIACPPSPSYRASIVSAWSGWPTGSPWALLHRCRGRERRIDSHSQCLDELSVSQVMAAVDQALARRQAA